ncbi:MAG TPA: 50S ribosomal protein L17 [Candidatus Moranbacteria bacterium]|nr:50S ribosomal protein L17 [Candidatus Moranbacteria bacterium]
MKHRKTSRQLGRVRKQRVALWRTMLGSLIINGRIVTTEAKAKELKPRIDRVITKAKRALEREGGGRRLAVYQIQKDIPAPAVRKLLADMDRFRDRDSGYTRIVKITPRRGDAAKMALIEFV